MLKRFFLVIAFLIIYVITSVPIGLFIYSLKSDLGINIFSKTGFHAYLECLSTQIDKIEPLNAETTALETEKTLTAEEIYRKEIEEKQKNSSN